MSREKGKRGEREVAELLRRYGYDGKRGVQYSGGPDSPDGTGLTGFHIEVKRTEGFRLYDALEQSAKDCYNGAVQLEYPTVVYRKNDKPWVVVMYFEDFLSVLKNHELTIEAMDNYVTELQNHVNELDHEISLVEEELEWERKKR